MCGPVYSSCLGYQAKSDEVHLQLERNQSHYGEDPYVHQDVRAQDRPEKDAHGWIRDVNKDGTHRDEEGRKSAVRPGGNSGKRETVIYLCANLYN